MQKIAKKKQKVEACGLVCGTCAKCSSTTTSSSAAIVCGGNEAVEKRISMGEKYAAQLI